MIYVAENNSGNGDDLITLTNKTNAAIAYTNEIRKTTEAIVAYAPTSTNPFEAGDNIEEARRFMSGIDKDTEHTTVSITDSVNTFLTKKQEIFG